MHERQEQFELHSVLHRAAAARGGEHEQAFDLVRALGPRHAMHEQLPDAALQQQLALRRGAIHGRIRDCRRRGAIEVSSTQSARPPPCTQAALRPRMSAAWLSLSSSSTAAGSTTL